MFYFVLLISFSGWLLGTMYMHTTESPGWNYWVIFFLYYIIFSCMSFNINDYVFRAWDEVILQGWSFLYTTSHHEDTIPGENSMASVLDKDRV